MDERQPTTRKLLLCPDMAFGRELLASLARHRGGWIGWQSVTLRRLAEELSTTVIAEKRLRIASDAEAEVIFDIALEGMSMDGILATSGARVALFDALQEMRVGGIETQQFRDTRLEYTALLADLHDAYERELRHKHLIDVAGLFRLALAQFDEESPFVIGESQVFVVPGWSVTGLPRRLLERIVERGAVALDAVEAWNDNPAPHTLVETIAPKVRARSRMKHSDASARLHTQAQLEIDLGAAPVSGVQFFHAADVSSELTAILRDAFARGARADEVEIACTDVDMYGVALDGICRRVGLRATMLEGLPLTGTRVGRAIDRWITWIENGFEADILRRGLEAGDYETGTFPGASFARLLRGLNAGWGREALNDAARRLRGESQRIERRSRADEGAGAAATRNALAAFLEQLMSAMPAVREYGETEDRYLSAAQLARSARHTLLLLRKATEADGRTIEHVDAQLAAIEKADGRELPSAEAILRLRRSLSHVRAWTEVSDTDAPKRATGGHIHLTDISHAGTTCRRFLYIAGLDAERSAGPVVQSSILSDRVRSLFPFALRTTEERRRLRRIQLAAAFVSSSSMRTASCAAGGNGGQENGPSHIMLEAWRSQNGKPAGTYEQLRAFMGTQRSTVPLPSEHPLDVRDLWLQLLQQSEGPLPLRDARPFVKQLDKGIARGLDAMRIRTMAANVTAWHGNVPAAAILDPRASGQAISPSSLEAYASCPLRWFYRSALRIYPPRVSTYNAAQWLDPAARGELLHSVFEKLISSGLHELPIDESWPHARAILHELANAYRTQLMPPGEAVFRTELRALEADCYFFLVDEHERWKEEPWQLVRSELEFGDNEGASISFADGTSLRVRGRIDRVDRLEGGLRVVDYKTGREFFDWSGKAPFGGARKLQLAVYAAAAEAVLSEPVTSAQYRFPTGNGAGATIAMDWGMLREARNVVADIVTEISTGRFLPTFDSSDCTFCDYAEVCRTSTDRGGRTRSPRADWARQNRALDEFAALRRWRGQD